MTGNTTENGSDIWISPGINLRMLAVKPTTAWTRRQWPEHKPEGGDLECRERCPFTDQAA